MNICVRFRLMSACAVVLAVAGCASVAPTAVSVRSALPEAPGGAQYLAYVVGKYQELAAGKWLTAGYVAQLQHSCH